jgi:membrane protein DedA with SNARE-associated domain
MNRNTILKIIIAVIIYGVLWFIAFPLLALNFEGFNSIPDSSKQNVLDLIVILISVIYWGVAYLLIRKNKKAS